MTTGRASTLLQDTARAQRRIRPLVAIALEGPNAVAICRAINGATRPHEAAPGSIIGVGTEINLVARLAKENPDKTVFCLDPIVCPCSTMSRGHPAYLAWVLEELCHGRVVNRIEVPEHHRAPARVALERMLALH